MKNVKKITNILFFVALVIAILLVMFSTAYTATDYNYANAYGMYKTYVVQDESGNDAGTFRSGQDFAVGDKVAFYVLYAEPTEYDYVWSLFDSADKSIKEVAVGNFIVVDTVYSIDGSYIITSGGYETSSDLILGVETSKSGLVGVFGANTATWAWIFIALVAILAWIDLLFQEKEEKEKAASAAVATDKKEEQKDVAEKRRLAKEKADKEKAEKAAKAAKDKAEKDRLAKEKAAKDAEEAKQKAAVAASVAAAAAFAKKEKEEKEAKEKAERDRIAKEKADKEAKEKEEARKVAAAAAAALAAKKAAEKQAAKEKADKEAAEKRAEKERLAKEKAEAERIEKEKAAKLAQRIKEEKEAKAKAEAEAKRVRDNKMSEVIKTAAAAAAVAAVAAKSNPETNEAAFVAAYIDGADDDTNQDGEIEFPDAFFDRLGLVVGDISLITATEIRKYVADLMESEVKIKIKYTSRDRYKLSLVKSDFAYVCQVKRSVLLEVNLPVKYARMIEEEYGLSQSVVVDDPNWFSWTLKNNTTTQQVSNIMHASLFFANYKYKKAAEAAAAEKQNAK